MSNLGIYQWMTKTSKKVGGPVNFLLLVGTTGAVVYKCSELGVKKCIKEIHTKRETKKKNTKMKEEVYTIITQGISNEGLRLIPGDEFTILETDGDNVLIEIMGDNDNPHFVSAELLNEVSNYKGGN